MPDNNNQVNKQVSERLEATNRAIQNKPEEQPVQNLNIQQAEQPSIQDTVQGNFQVSEQDLLRYKKIGEGIEEPEEPKGSQLLGEVLRK